MLKYLDYWDIVLFSLLSIYPIIWRYSATYSYSIGVFAIGLGLIIWWAGRLTLGDAATWLPIAKKIVTRGIYSKIRHPIYIGQALCAAGWIFIIESLAVRVICVAIILITIVRAILEERVLTKRFGKQYLEYKKRTLF
tara:strand:+ start:1222 stop:1635 length:414 start_codon:yes stop_codon:yes gene_type:complete